MTHLIPQLADSIDLRELPAFCVDGNFAATQKADGHRRLIYVDDGEILPLNRNGEPTTLPILARRDLARIRGDWAFDAELIGTQLWLFDMPVAGSVIAPDSPYVERRQALDNAFARWAPSSIGLLPVAWTHEDKVSLAKRLLLARAEGLILNRLDARYLPGPKRNPGVLKAKFIKTVDCVVTELGRDGKHNMVVAVFDNGTRTEIGEVTALAGDGSLVTVGDVVEVTYLYASEDHRLVQPTLPRIRRDKSPADCTIDQLVMVSKEILT